MSRFARSRLARNYRGSRLPPRVPDRIKEILFRKTKSTLTKKDKKELEQYVKESKSQYRPSLVAVIYDITSYTIPKRVSGLEIRPIIKRVKRSRKK